ncbi:MAG TPA: nicotinate-nucleotide--dimethylbenzimidazole phosphoribosyltransferase [Bacillota bacterium]|nr:nicotinate-nucleotide--dimethylbenzimidazole phosphoribosyltransferase [Fastidiosipila sp.]HPX92713.1 nicotinate-nucleotide--dimethylbenzimidazole phosphoribosyltransferase [Bacillota bacterium]HQB80610.1 nicotinate-nucleotide--dimethylbenzimidazole phosphoribosyltransferase [Bacillota bacterium]
MKAYSRADFLLELANRPGLDEERIQEVSREWARRQGTPSLLAANHARLAGWIASIPFDVRQRALFLFASESRIMEEGGLAAHQDLPLSEEVRLLAGGKQAVNGLAELTHTQLVTVNLGTGKPDRVKGTVHVPVSDGGANNIMADDAMTEETMMTAIRVGMELVSQAFDQDFTLLSADGLSEGSEVTATAMLSVLFDRPPEALMERGENLPDPVFYRRSQILAEAISRRAPNPHNTFDVLKKLGSLEIAAITGFFAGAALYGMPVLLGGTVPLTAALTLVRLIPETRPLFFATLPPADPGGELALRELGLTPLVDDRTPSAGRGSALYVTPLLDLICSLYNGFQDPLG